MSSAPARRGWLVAALVVGLGLVAAPAIFQMFDRAPKGGDMIEAFRPYMTQEKITEFQDYMVEIDTAVAEMEADLEPALVEDAGLDAAEIDESYVSYADFKAQWDEIFTEMTDMLDTMEANLGNFDAVSSLPPFLLFPWFFVIPGLLIAGIAGWGLVRSRRGESGRGVVIALVVMGVGLIAAPAVFQMFTRAPKGGDMINEFRYLMNEEKVQAVQGYFLVIGAGEGTVRVQMLPAFEEAGATPPELPATDQFIEDWPTISNEMAPMIGTMADNVVNYQAVDDLPPFPLFPWFFVLPALLIIGFAVAAGRPAERDHEAVPAVPSGDRAEEV
ncbi:MAG: hypothetical protein M5U31_03810 [Acidimicrobiia bacterium]|nr:hypothetical protein [Acidimicrobiia bacterium]